ncbi:MAG: hypothetical protein KAV87_55640 [Desulfobacteraceae bacterium]|nr:hypothetical protein [Desulfobacteraceae bacterium]
MDNNQFMYGFGSIINAMGGGGDRGQSFPQSDTDDFASGARYIPGEVTLARRRGEQVIFHPNSQEWEMPSGKMIT